MNAINITNTSKQSDGTYKINFNATYDKSSHIEGFIFMSNDDYLSKTGSQQIQQIIDTLTKDINPSTDTTTEEETK